MDKKQLREYVLNKRAALSPEEVRAKSNVICSKLAELPEFKNAQRMAFYVSIRNEVFTHSLIKELLEKKQIVVPVYGSEAVLSKLEDWSDLAEGSFGILEPKKILAVTLAEIEVLIVPGIAFDINGNRIGYGKGFYDQLLRKTNGEVIALAYDEQVLESVPKEGHDVRVHKIITEKRIINCENDN
jgi:5-formyltetrahydrofolate cyclo-ligase